MEAYDAFAQRTAKQVIQSYSTSFGTASRLLGPASRQDIYNIYGLVRLADEIVDSYQQQLGLAGASDTLDAFEQEVYQATRRHFSINPVVHAFQLTAQKYAIGQELIQPFFASMRLDLQRQVYDQAKYEAYIYGSAEVVGLMCLKVFTGNSQAIYRQLAPGAQALGAAYQKINFLRDIAADRQKLGRSYFPQLGDNDLTDAHKAAIILDIRANLQLAQQYIKLLPPSSRKAVMVSFAYYEALLNLLDQMPAAVVQRQRLRISNGRKLLIASRVWLGLA